MRRVQAVAASVLCVGACAVIGGMNGPQKPSRAFWYVALRKPSDTPPGPVVGGTWGLLEGLLVAAGVRLMQRPRSCDRDLALAGWGAVLTGLAGFPWLFFRKHRLGMATVVAGAMLAASTKAAVAAWRVDRTASLMLAPVAAWLAYASLLSGRLWAANRRLSSD